MNKVVFQVYFFSENVIVQKTIHFNKKFTLSVFNIIIFF